MCLVTDTSWIIDSNIHHVSDLRGQITLAAKCRYKSLWNVKFRVMRGRGLDVLTLCFTFYAKLEGRRTLVLLFILSSIKKDFFFPGCLKKFTQSVVSRIHVSSLLVHLDLGKFNILPAGPQKSSLDVA